MQRVGVQIQTPPSVRGRPITANASTMHRSTCQEPWAVSAPGRGSSSFNLCMWASSISSLA
jgi:hypothetical protein